MLTPGLVLLEGLLVGLFGGGGGVYREKQFISEGIQRPQRAYLMGEKL